MDPLSIGLLTLGGGLGVGALLDKGKKGGFEKTSTLDPEQQKMMERLGQFVPGRIGEGLPAWTGDFTAPLSQFEELGLGKLGDYLKGGPGAAAEAGIGAFTEGVKGMDPEAVHDWYMKYQAPQERAYMEEEIIPSIREEHVPSGTLWGSPRYGDVERAWRGFGQEQLGRIGQAIQTERASARSLIPYTGEMAGIEGGLPQIEASQRFGALPRVLKQQELEGRIREFERTTPELNPILNLARDILGITTQATAYRPYQPSPFMEMFKAVAPAVGQAVGASAGAGGFSGVA